MNDDLKNHATTHVVLQAHMDALEALTLAGLSSLGLSSLDGISLPEWLFEKQKRCLQQQMFAIEDYNPAVAAELQAYIDALQKPNA